MLNVECSQVHYESFMLVGARAAVYWFSEDKKGRVFYTRELTVKTGFAQMKEREPLSRLNASDN
jgi:hypothetical protein